MRKRALLSLAVVFGLIASLAVEDAAGLTAPPVVHAQVGPRVITLATGSYCWKTTCADMLPPKSRTDIPRAVLANGSRIQITLGFRATSWRVGRLGSSHSERLPAGRSGSFVVSGSGIYSVEIDHSANGSASYLIRITVT